MAQNNRMRVGYFNRDLVQSKIDDNTLNGYDIAYTKDTNEALFIAPDLTIVPIQSRVYNFQDKTTAEAILNTKTDTYEGQIVSVKSQNVYHAYVVNKNEEGKFVIEDATYVPSYEDLIDTPVVPEAGTTEEPVVPEELDPGMYSISGEYQIPGTTQVVSSDAPVTMWVTNTYVQYVKDGEIVRYNKDEDSVEKYVTDADLQKKLATEDDINDIFN